LQEIKKSLSPNPVSKLTTNKNINNKTGV
jgi:hypothetical protein